MRIAGGVVLCLAALSLAACSSNPRVRAVEGAALGAGTGAVGAVIVGGSVGTAAAVGAAGGALVGALTDESEIDLDFLVP